MPTEIGRIEALYRYPVKSMRGESLDTASLDWHGIIGDRRLALRRLDDPSGFPWLSASRLPELILFTPVSRQSPPGDLPTHVRTPDGAELDVLGPELAADIGQRVASPVQMMHLRQGIFDEAGISVITAATVTEIGKLSMCPPDVRRFRPNIVIRSVSELPFEEDDWVNGILSFGTQSGAATVAVTHRDVRCSMINLDPDSARPDPAVLRTTVKERNNQAGVYGTVTRCGPLQVGQSILFEASPGPS